MRAEFSVRIFYANDLGEEVEEEGFEISCSKLLP